MNTYGLFEKYYPLSNGKQLKVELYFNRDTYSWGTGERKPIGYMGSYTPVMKGEFFEEVSGDDPGNWEMILEAERQSKKRKEEAIAILKNRIPFIISVFERKIHPEALTFEDVERKGYTIDASGIDDLKNWLWEKKGNIDVWYPTIQIMKETFAVS